MRKEYVKPMLLAESFQLTDHITGACNFVDQDTTNFKVTWHSASNCSLSVKGENGWLPAMFTDTSNNCSEIGILPGEFEHTPLEECYNSMGTNFNYFAS